MSKTITLRLTDDEYELLAQTAAGAKRTISNLITYLALKKIEEDVFADQDEMRGILENPTLVARLKRGAGQAQEMQGSFVDV